MSPDSKLTGELVSAVYRNLLNVTPSTDDDFFDLGGHSMLAVLAIAELSEAVGAELPLTLIFDHPKAGELAHAIRGYLENTDVPTP